LEKVAVNVNAPVGQVAADAEVAAGMTTASMTASG
jgi:hypothetical protein